MKKVIIAVGSITALGVLPLIKSAINNHTNVSAIRKCARLLREEADSGWNFKKQVGGFRVNGSVDLVTLMQSKHNTGMVIYHCEDGYGNVIHSGYADWYDQYAGQLEAQHTTVKFITLK